MKLFIQLIIKVGEIFATLIGLAIIIHFAMNSYYKKMMKSMRADISMKDKEEMNDFKG